MASGALPSTDAELLDWMEARLQGGVATGAHDQMINFNLASEYYPGGFIRRFHVLSCTLCMKSAGA